MTTKHKLILSAAAAIAVLLAYSLGRYATPPRTVVTERVVTVEKQVVVTQERAVVKVVTVHDTVREIHRVSVATARPDGTITRTVTTDSASRSQSETAAATTLLTQRTRATQVEQRQIAVAQRAEDGRPTWSLSFAGMYAFASNGPSLLQAAFSLPPKVYVQVGLERRIAGPLSAGIYVSSRYDAGLSLRLSW